MDLFSRVFRDFRLTWPQLLTTDLAYKLVAFVLLTPLVSLALRVFVSTSGSAVLADTDILFFVLSPIGLVALVVVAAVSLAIVGLEQACLMVIGFGATRDTRVGLTQALWYGARHAVSVLHLTSRIVLRVLLIAAPFLAAGGIVYLALVSKHDINYYLAEKPPIFWLAALAVGALLLVMTVLLVRRLVGWAFALPLLLFENVGASRALATSEERTKGHRWVVAVGLVSWAVATAALSALALGTVGLLGRWIGPSVAGWIGILIFVIGGLLLLWGAANLIISLVSASAFALLIVRLYHRFGASPVETEAKLSQSFVPESLEAGTGWVISRRTLLWSLAAAVVVAALLGVFLVRSIRLQDDVTVTAHRGASGAAPENTLAAMERAIADGADFVEVDVQETADGEVVVIHDSDLKKIGGVDLKIWDATYEQLQGIDVGSWFAPEFRTERVPKLEQVLELCKGRIRVNIELKYYGHDERLEERMVEIVETAGMQSDIVVMSLKRDAVEKVQNMRPDWSIGLLTATVVGDLTAVDVDFLAVNTGLATPDFVRRAHESGKEVLVWTVNDPINMSRMISRGVDSIITDEPALLRTVLERRANFSSVERLMVEAAFLLGVVPEAPTPANESG
jgi:glycerophosphoryl diester phosphodiesterase